MAKRSIYVPLLSEELDLLAAMAEQAKRSTHDQAAHLIEQAVHRWRAEQALQRALEGEELEGVA